MFFQYNRNFGTNVRVTACSHQGARKYMEDYFEIVYKFTPDNRDVEYVYFGVFDGHGGREAAAFAKKHLLQHILKQEGFKSTDDKLVLQAIRDGFIDCHHAMWESLERWPRTASGFPSTSGTTASVLIMKNGKMYVANVGDSTIVLGRREIGGEHFIGEALTEDHKPESPQEKRRIEDAGGSVMPKSGVPRVVWYRPKPRQPSSSTCSTMSHHHHLPHHRHHHHHHHQQGLWDSTVTLPNTKPCPHPSHPTPTNKLGVEVDEIPFLAVGRSLGDLWSFNACRNQFSVSPIPDVRVLEIDPARHKCAIVASDGLWNMLTPQSAVRIVEESEREMEKRFLEMEQIKGVVGGQPETSTGRGENSLPNINPAQQLVTKALHRWQQRGFRADNTTAIVVLLDPLGPSKVSVMTRQLMMKRLRPRPSIIAPAVGGAAVSADDGAVSSDCDVIPSTSGNTSLGVAAGGDVPNQFLSSDLNVPTAPPTSTTATPGTVPPPNKIARTTRPSTTNLTHSRITPIISPTNKFLVKNSPLPLSSPLTESAVSLGKSKFLVPLTPESSEEETRKSNSLTTDPTPRSSLSSATTSRRMVVLRRSSDGVGGEVVTSKPAIIRLSPRVRRYADEEYKTSETPSNNDDEKNSEDGKNIVKITRIQKDKDGNWSPEAASTSPSQTKSGGGEETMMTSTLIRTSPSSSESCYKQQHSLASGRLEMMNVWIKQQKEKMLSVTARALPTMTHLTSAVITNSISVSTTTMTACREVSENVVSLRGRSLTPKHTGCSSGGGDEVDEVVGGEDEREEEGASSDSQNSEPKCGGDGKVGRVRRVRRVKRSTSLISPSGSNTPSGYGLRTRKRGLVSEGEAGMKGPSSGSEGGKRVRVSVTSAKVRRSTVANTMTK